jgi:hypothetical protein
MRGRIPVVVVVDDRPAAACAVTITDTRSDQRAAVYADPDSERRLEQPLRTDDCGGVPGWVAAGEYSAAVDVPASLLHGERFNVGGPVAEGPTHTPVDAPALPLADGWSRLGAYTAPVAWRNEAGEIELAGVAEPAASPPTQRVIAVLAPELRPERPVCLPTLLGAPGAEGTKVHPTHLCAFPDGRVIAPDEPMRWILVNGTLV